MNIRCSCSLENTENFPICKKCGFDWEAGVKFLKNIPESKMDKAKRELTRFKELVDEVWDEEMTDRDELIYLKFFKAGVEIDGK